MQEQNHSSAPEQQTSRIDRPVANEECCIRIKPNAQWVKGEVKECSQGQSKPGCQLKTVSASMGSSVCTASHHFFGSYRNKNCHRALTPYPGLKSTDWLDQPNTSQCNHGLCQGQMVFNRLVIWPLQNHKGSYGSIILVAGTISAVDKPPLLSLQPFFHYFVVHTYYHS